MPPSLGKPGGPGSPLCLWPGRGDGVVTQSTARKGSGTYGLWRDLLAAVGGMSSLQILSGTSGDTGLLGMGTSNTQPGLADRGSIYGPAQPLAGMTGWAHAGDLHTRGWGAQHPGVLHSSGTKHSCPGRLSTHSPSGDGQGGYGDLLLRVPQQPPTQDLWRGGGRLFWHHLLALPLSAQGRNHVPCSKQCYCGRIRPRSRNANVTTCPGHSLAGPCSPSLGRVDLQINNRAALFPRGQGLDLALSSRHMFS